MKRKEAKRRFKKTGPQSPSGLACAAGAAIFLEVFLLCFLPLLLVSLLLGAPGGWVLLGACVVWLFRSSVRLVVSGRSVVAGRRSGVRLVFRLFVRRCVVLAFVFSSVVLFASGGSGVLGVAGSFRSLRSLALPRALPPSLRGSRYARPRLPAKLIWCVCSDHCSEHPGRHDRLHARRPTLRTGRQGFRRPSTRPLDATWLERQLTWFQ